MKNFIQNKRKILPAFLWLSWIVITGCSGARAIYGVPENQWEQMNSAERQATIEYYKQQEEINAQTRFQAEKAREQAKSFDRNEAETFARQCRQSPKNMSDPSKCKVISRHRWGF